MKQLLSQSRGQSLVEFAMILPLLMIMAFGIIDFAMATRSYVSLTNATREGGRYAAVGHETGSFPSDCTDDVQTTVIGRVCTTLEGLNQSDLETITVTYPDGQASGNEVIVSADYTYNYITPIGDIGDFFTGGAFADSISLSTSSNMRVE